MHLIAFVTSLAAGGALVLASEGERRQLVAAVFAGSVAVCFGTSALYHRVAWAPRTRLWMRRLDHAGVFLLIAGTYTPVCLLVLQGAWRFSVLAVVWGGAGFAVLVKFIWVQAPKSLAALTAIVLGWVGVAALPQLVNRLSPFAVALFLAGGVSYTVGACIYAVGRPDPLPRVFGYHELFHALTIVAVTCQYVAIAFFVLGVG
jgi:hemolysin III